MRFLTLLLSVVLAAAVSFLVWQLSLAWSADDSASGEPGPTSASEFERVGPSVVAPSTAAAAADPEHAARELLLARHARAIELLRAERLEEAVELFEECYADDPDEVVFRDNLVESLVRVALREHEGDEASVGRAIDALARATELAPTRGDLVGLLDRWRKTHEAEQDYTVLRTLHFEIHFDWRREELSDEFYSSGSLESVLEDTYHTYGELFAFYPVEAGRPRIKVVVYRREDFTKITGLGDWVGGVFDGSVRVPVETLDPARLASLERVLRHELLHAFAASIGGNDVPGWLNEGLAQWYEPEGRARPDAARAYLRGRDLFPLDRLGGSLVGLEDPADVQLAYAQSLAFVMFVAEQYGEHLPFDLVTRIGEGQTAAAAFEALTHGRTLEDALTDLRLEIERQ